MLVFLAGLLVAPSCLTSASLIGQVIKAWDIGVATMRKGEICYLLCKPEYAYGSAGSAPKIPSNATLFFEASKAGVWMSSLLPFLPCQPARESKKCKPKTNSNMKNPA